MGVLYLEDGPIDPRPVVAVGAVPVLEGEARPGWEHDLVRVGPPERSASALTWIEQAIPRDGVVRGRWPIPVLLDPKSIAALHLDVAADVKDRAGRRRRSRRGWRGDSRSSNGQHGRCNEGEEPLLQAEAVLRLGLDSRHVGSFP